MKIDLVRNKIENRNLVEVDGTGRVETITGRVVKALKKA